MNSTTTIAAAFLELFNVTSDGEALVDDDFKLAFACVVETILLVYATVLMLAPHKASELFGTVDIVKQFKKAESESVLHYLTQRSNLCLVCGCTCFFQLIQNQEEKEGTNVDMAARHQIIGITLLPWILGSLHSLLNDMPRKIGNGSSQAEYNTLFLVSFAIYSIFTTKSKFVDFAIWSLIGYTALHGLIWYINPRFLDNLYSIPERDDYIYACRRSYGYNIFNLGIIYATMMYGLHWQTILLIGWTISFVALLGMLNDVKKFSMKMGPIYGWLTLMFIVIVVFSI